MEDKVVLKAEYRREQGSLLHEFEVLLDGDTMITSLALELEKYLPKDERIPRMPGDKVRIYRPDGSYMEFELVMRWQMTAR